VALGDDDHVDVQASRYRHRLEEFRDVLSRAYDVDVTMPGGGLYLWLEAPGGDAWAFARRVAEEAGALVSPGDFYGPRSAGYVRIAMVQPDDRLALVAKRLGQ
jgi:aspartate/methionine/tyrosine aminotransferase